jgi:hypothetical protein
MAARTAANITWIRSRAMVRLSGPTDAATEVNGTTGKCTARESSFSLAERSEKGSGSKVNGFVGSFNIINKSVNMGNSC